MVDILDVLKYNSWSLESANSAMKRFVNSSFLTDFFGINAAYIDSPCAVAKDSLDDAMGGAEYNDLDEHIRDAINSLSGKAMKTEKIYIQSGATGQRAHAKFVEEQKALVEHAYEFIRLSDSLLQLKTVLSCNEDIKEMADVIRDMIYEQHVRERKEWEKAQQEKEKQKREKDVSSYDGSDIDAIMGGPLAPESVLERFRKNVSAASDEASDLREQISKIKENVLAASNKTGGAADTTKEMVPPETIFRN